MAKIGNIALRYLLIITMVIQPALFSHAMASMEHGDAAIQMQSHEMRHAVHDDGAYHQHNDKSHNVDGCCHTPACGPALIVDAVVVLQPQRPLYPRIVEHSFYDVDLPVSIKPPRILF